METGKRSESDKTEQPPDENEVVFPDHNKYVTFSLLFIERR